MPLVHLNLVVRVSFSIISLMVPVVAAPFRQFLISDGTHGRVPAHWNVSLNFTTRMDVRVFDDSKLWTVLTKLFRCAGTTLVGISVSAIVYMRILSVTPVLIQSYMRTSRVGGNVTLTSPPCVLILIWQTLCRAPHIRVCRMTRRYHPVVRTQCFIDSIYWKRFCKFKRVITQSSSRAGQVILRTNTWKIDFFRIFITSVTIRDINVSVTCGWPNFFAAIALY